MSRPKCIVCGKQIKKKFRHLSFYPATGNRRQNFEREDNHIYLDEELRPKSKEEAQRYTNHEILNVSMDHRGLVWSIKWWEGEYDDPYFCTGTCARKQGYASARQGERFTWSNR